MNIIAYVVASLVVGAIAGVSAYFVQHASLTGQLVSPDAIINSENETPVAENTTKCSASCDDNNPCSLDWCNGTSNYQCSHIPINGTSDECWGNPTQCSTNTCVSGKCIETVLTGCCGNSICESSEGCNSCAADCGDCPITVPNKNQSGTAGQQLESNSTIETTQTNASVEANTTANQTNNNTIQNNTTPTQTASLNHIIISEVQAGPNEFVELYNPTNADVNAVGWYLSYYSSGRDWNNTYRNWAIPNNTVLKAGKFFLINVFNTNNSDWTALTAEGNPYSSGQISNNGSMAVFPFNPRTNTIENDKNGRIDAIGWGAPVYVFEFSSAIAPQDGKSLQRNSLTSDTDSNSQDFSLSISPSPKNSTNQ